MPSGSVTAMRPAAGSASAGKTTLSTRRPPPGTIFNDQILGVAVPIDSATGLVDLDDAVLEALINGKIDESRVLPSAGFTYRALEGMNIRGAYSQTVARPSFREMGYYVSVEPGSDDLIIGNPQMKLSDVESFDARDEYVYGETGDLGAAIPFLLPVAEHSVIAVKRVENHAGVSRDKKLRVTPVTEMGHQTTKRSRMEVALWVIK